MDLGIRSGELGLVGAVAMGHIRYGHGLIIVGWDGIGRCALVRIGNIVIFYQFG